MREARTDHDAEESAVAFVHGAELHAVGQHLFVRGWVVDGLERGKPCALARALRDPLQEVGALLHSECEAPVIDSHCMQNDSHVSAHLVFTAAALQMPLVETAPCRTNCFNGSTQHQLPCQTSAVRAICTGAIQKQLLHRFYAVPTVRLVFHSNISMHTTPSGFVLAGPFSSVSDRPLPWFCRCFVLA